MGVFFNHFYSQLFVRPAIPTKSFAGQTVIITGSNVGLGKEAARHIAALGASKLILAVRNIKAGEEAKKDIENTTQCGKSVIEVWQLDLASYESVKSFANRALTLQRIDVLLENAGIATQQYATAEGHERTLTVNVISTFLLALLLLPKLKATAKDFKTEPRLTIVSSEVHAWVSFPQWNAPSVFEELDNKEKASMSMRYPLSKLLEVLVIREIAPKLDGSGIILNYLNPGLCRTELGREGNFALKVMYAVRFARTTEMGSRTLVASAAAGRESHGKWFTDGKVNDGALGPFPRSKDGKKASEKIWVELAEILENIQPGVTKNF